MEHTPDQNCHRRVIGFEILSVVFGSVEPKRGRNRRNRPAIQSRRAIRSALLDIPLAERNVHRGAI